MGAKLFSGKFRGGHFFECEKIPPWQMNIVFSLNGNTIEYNPIESSDAIFVIFPAMFISAASRRRSVKTY